MQGWPRWALWSVLVVTVLAAGTGTCIQQNGGSLPIPFPKPAPSPVVDPVPTPTPTPIPVPKPTDLWQPLDAPTANSVPGLELPAPMEISSSRRYITITAKSANKVKWLVSSQIGKLPDVLVNESANTIMVLPTPNTADVIAVLAYTANNGIPTAAAITFIKITADRPLPVPGPTPNPTPTPDPNPTPVPAPKVTKLHLTFFLDFSHQTRAISDIVNNKELREMLASDGHDVHELSAKDVATIKALGLDKDITGKNPPLLIIQAKQDGGEGDGVFIDAIPLTSVQAVKDAVTKYTGK